MKQSIFIALLMLSFSTFAAGNVTFMGSHVRVQSGQGWDKILVDILCNFDLSHSQFYQELQSIDRNPNSKLLDVLGNQDEGSVTFKYQVLENGILSEKLVKYTLTPGCGISGYGKWNEYH